jgi:ADP-ribose pyrophosphatase YjhB (NUDIX family)
MTLPCITSIEHHPALSGLRVQAQPSFKAGIVPFFVQDGDIKLVVYAPVPQREVQHGTMLPFQIARGTMQTAYRVGGLTQWFDKGRHTAPLNAEPLYDEPYVTTALREAHEELGLHEARIIHLYDCGWLPYQNPKGSTYNIYMFLAQITDASVLDMPDPYACAARLDGVNLTRLQALSVLPPATSYQEQRPFKASYMPMIEALYHTISDIVK